MDTARYAALFASEGREHLKACNEQLLLWEEDPANAAPVRELFRAVHTLKGMAGAMGYARLAGLAHAFEHLLASVRDGSVTSAPAVVDLAFRTVDRLEAGMALAVVGQDGALVVDALEKEMADLARGIAPAPRPARADQPSAPGRTADAGRGVLFRLRLKPGTPMPAARLAVLVRGVERLGFVSAVTPPPDAWMSPAFDGAVAFRYLGPRPPEEVRALLNAAPEVVEVEVGEHTAPGAQQVRVAMRRLDRLLGLSGELVVARNRLNVMLAGRRDPALEEALHTVDRLVTNLHEQVLRTRMAPVGEVFERFPRAVRDLAQRLGKRVRLELAGRVIELDRTLLDELADPLLHLIRNAVDHGIEPPGDRTAAGKPAEGRIRLSARRERNSVVIDLEDDGRGVDREAVMARAAGIEDWAEGEAPVEGEGLLDLLARPGFSTAREVTDVSGRGVGMDAVMHWVRRRGGVMSLTSRPGSGTTITLRLPLTVAVVPALLVGVSDQCYALPLPFVAETTQLRPVGEGMETEYRGERLSAVDLSGEASAPAAAWRPGVILEVAGRRGVLAVDSLVGREDVLVSPLPAANGVPPWINGATILADGRPALILDPAALVQRRAT